MDLSWLATKTDGDIFPELGKNGGDAVTTRCVCESQYPDNGQFQRRPRSQEQIF